MRVKIGEVDIPKEMSQFAELKTLVAHVGHSERSIANAFRRAADQWREEEAKQEQWSTTAKRCEKTPNWRRSKRRYGRQSDGPDLPSALETHRAARVTHAGHGGGDVLHFVRTKKQRNRDRNEEAQAELTTNM